MKLQFKDEPKEWRKSALLAAFGLALICSLLRWRHHLGQTAWLFVISSLVVIAGLAVYQPRWFRGYHLFSMRLGHAFSRGLGRIFLTVIFIFIITPLGWILRLTGNDPLRLKSETEAKTYWHTAKGPGPLDRMF